MATFELTAPDGGTYHVDAPDEHAAVDALGKMMGSSKAPETAAQAAPAAGPSVLSPRPTGDTNPFEEYRQKPARPFQSTMTDVAALISPAACAWPEIC
jgi:hypothetical protein